jgi:Flp pilus assembly protein TadD
MRWVTLMIKGNALRSLGRHDEAIANCRQACQFPDVGFLPLMHLAAALAEAGQGSTARAAIEKTKQLQPAHSIGFIHESFRPHARGPFEEPAR